MGPLVKTLEVSLGTIVFGAKNSLAKKTGRNEIIAGPNKRGNPTKNPRIILQEVEETNRG